MRRFYLSCGAYWFYRCAGRPFDISVDRATIQAAIRYRMMVFGKLYLSSLGYIFWLGEMVLGPSAISLLCLPYGRRSAHFQYGGRY